MYIYERSFETKKKSFMISNCEDNKNEGEIEPNKKK